MTEESPEKVLEGSVPKDVQISDKEEVAPAHVAPTWPEHNFWWCVLVDRVWHATMNGRRAEEPPGDDTQLLCNHHHVTDEIPSRYRLATCNRCMDIILNMRRAGVR